MDDLYSVKQVAIFLKIHHLTVRRYISEGKLKAIKVGGNIRITQNELRVFSEVYLPKTKSTKVSSNEANKTIPFAANDSLFRLKGRGLSMDNFKR